MINVNVTPERGEVVFGFPDGDLRIPRLTITKSHLRAGLIRFILDVRSPPDGVQGEDRMAEVSRQAEVCADRVWDALWEGSPVAHHELGNRDLKKD